MLMGTLDGWFGQIGTAIFPELIGRLRHVLRFRVDVFVLNIEILG